MLALISIISLGGCATPGVTEIAARGGMTITEADGTAYRHLVVHRRATPPGTTLHVYIEGDGIPWVGNYPSADPTPVNTLALRLAAQDPHDVAYIGRPCYFDRSETPPCHPRDWTSRRYGEPIVASMAAAIESVRKPRHTGVVLIGHSGGGVLAALLESRINDVVGVISIGANLDIDAWTDFHGYDRLVGSLNPIAQKRPPGIPHAQLVGARDRNVPESITREYERQMPNVDRIVYRDFDHVCCWERAWPKILAAHVPSPPVGTGHQR